eukprot:4225443-Pleurochrysis_carterae.AAC.7
MHDCAHAFASSKEPIALVNREACKSATVFLLGFCVHIERCRMRASMRLSVRPSVHTCLQIQVHMCGHFCMCACMRVRVHGCACAHVCACGHLNRFMPVCAYVRGCMHVPVDVGTINLDTEKQCELTATFIVIKLQQMARRGRSGSADYVLL